MTLGTRWALWGTLLFLFSCGSTEELGEDESNQGPGSVFSGLEERLVGSEETGFEFHVTAEGAIEVDLRGALVIGPGKTVELSASGYFAGEEVDLRLASNGTSYEFGRLPTLSSGLVPPKLKEALLMGYTRMGILHNLAMLSAGAPPDRVGGGVEDWASTHGFTFLPHEGPEDSKTIGFSLTVDGVPAGTASLDLDGAGLPVTRRQTVLFPEGEMRVLERYLSVKIRP